ncbi:MAG: hypothetical protein CVV64_03755 [Candidatus Wallbacteria bacterium HGW-Wallbacteria-1]|jgi:hypothetical protein|uniref:Uncharacterized protein n=1 Tax=Candidatus Wallbacteria bacterium HGW-Wallbacteria-1 TaxID=2013854 RepID=A0A2N1PTW3_9BACT|nr:MAG: hypothetical protein CVV64_03755 [Candidatus Wallbacteria bacterium HGW-Wallbacteria-1]
MTEDRIKIHDRYQFELKLGYSIDFSKSVTTYETDVYLFFPGNLGVDAETYTRPDFYRDLQTYVRFKTPSYSLRQLASDSPLTPLSKLRCSCESLVNENSTNLRNEFEFQLKMFGCILKSSLRDHVSYIRKKSNSEDIAQLVDDYLDCVAIVTRNFRKLRSIINVPNIEDRIFSTYQFGDELMSQLIEKHTYKLLSQLKKRNLLSVLGSHDERLLDLVKREIQYRKKLHYPSIPDENGTNEVLLFRASVLKKFAESVLFLNARSKNESAILEHFLMGSAAAISMTVALLITYFVQLRFGAWTLPFFVVAIVGYAFKDRVKEIGRHFVSGNILKHLYDRAHDIRTSKKRKIGYNRERFEFLNEREVDNKVLKLRNRDHITEIEDSLHGEMIIRYRKKITLITDSVRKAFRDYPVNSVNDISRFNIFKFLGRMDNPTKSLHVCGEKGWKKISGHRTYHLNLVIRISHREHGIIFKRYRVILDKDGIKRIEKVSSENEINSLL